MADKKPRQHRLRLVPGEYLLSLESCMAKCDIGRTKLLDMIAAGEFPQPLKDKRLGSLQRWLLSDVDAWMHELRGSLENAAPMRAVK